MLADAQPLVEERVEGALIAFACQLIQLSFKIFVTPETVGEGTAFLAEINGTEFTQAIVWEVVK